MPYSPVVIRRRLGRRPALVGLTGAVLAGLGDMLLLARPISGPDFDRAADLVPRDFAVDEMWRSLWNGAAVSPRRIRAGSVIGVLGIGVLGAGMGGSTRALRPGALRHVAAASAAAFTAAGALTHWSCAEVVANYRTATLTEGEPSAALRPAPRSATRLLMGSTAVTLTSLAAYSVALTGARLLRCSTLPAGPSFVTPLPCVVAALLTFGRLPAPIGGYARPASISIGLLTHFAVSALWAERDSSGSVTG